MPVGGSVRFECTLLFLLPLITLYLEHPRKLKKLMRVVTLSEVQ